MFKDSLELWRPRNKLEKDFMKFFEVGFIYFLSSLNTFGHQSQVDLKSPQQIMLTQIDCDIVSIY